MTRRERLIIDSAAVLSALKDEGVGTAVPASTFYIVLDSDMARYQAVTGFLERAGFAQVTSTTVAITAKGIEVAEVLEGKLREVGVEL